ncbi:MAG TPA: formyltransferase family protein [Candidatus Polarisedimenticolia bacterium]|nr:formyltransferase family protein [Candidatus Polarisedimenticolia bacterium]
MRVVALCDSLPAAARLWRRLDGMPEVDLRVLVIGGPLRRVRGSAAVDWRTAARLLVTGRLFFAMRGLDHPSAVARLRALRPAIGLCACGTICRKPLIDCFERGILSPHPGLLPEYRGRAAMEWSILEGRPTGITVFFLDPGIGTGKEIVLRREVRVAPAPDLPAARRRLAERDAEFFREALERLRSPAYRPLENHGRGRRFYAMSRLFTGVVEQALNRASGACT